MNRSDTKPIVVGVDGSPAATGALRWALDEAGIRGCAVHVVNAWDYEPLTDWAETAERNARASSEALVEAAIGEAVFGRTDPPVIVRRCLRGIPAEVLESASRDADLLVVGSHTGHRLRDIVLGSTSALCVRHVTVPVVLIPARTAPLDTRIAAGHAADHG
ncbi:universal stress protein [Umezawaea sp. Da 62-37]|uniref:universal stress protein n=1 Tax=Umezawaea sp. Da 62-37 TaxID=3075927 RepID=UPI0028F70564|nr:universal stress protein [Umezawaea sp. Da 62-37]WNV84802.1 universal stress protein [Umezawaea sp. Da 62-37]